MYQKLPGPPLKVFLEKYLVIIFAITTLIFALSTAYLINKTRETKIETPESKKEVKEEKHLLLPAVVYFDPSKKYVRSSVTYQQVAGKIISYEEGNQLLILEEAGEKFSIKLPLGENATYNPPQFADVSGLYSFKVGDTVVIGGQIGVSGDFEITRFVIQKETEGLVKE